MVSLGELARGIPLVEYTKVEPEKPGKRRLLILENDPYIAEIMELNLGAFGYNIVGVYPKAEDGIKKLREDKKKNEGNPVCDQVITDLNLDGPKDQDGWYAARIIHTEHLAKEGIVIISATRFPSQYDSQQLINMGILGYLQKPFDFERLVEEIEKGKTNYS